MINQCLLICLRYSMIKNKYIFLYEVIVKGNSKKDIEDTYVTNKSMMFYI